MQIKKMLKINGYKYVIKFDSEFWATRDRYLTEDSVFDVYQAEFGDIFKAKKGIMIPVEML